MSDDNKFGDKKNFMANMGMMPFAAALNAGGMGNFQMPFGNYSNNNKSQEMGNQMPFFWMGPQGYQMPMNNHSSKKDTDQKEFLGKRGAPSKKTFPTSLHQDNDYSRIECPELCKLLSELDIPFDSIDKTFYLLLCKKALLQCEKKTKKYKMKDLSKYLSCVLSKIDEKLLKNGNLTKKEKEKSKKEPIDDSEKVIGDLELLEF